MHRPCHSKTKKLRPRTGSNSALVQAAHANHTPASAAVPRKFRLLLRCHLVAFGAMLLSPDLHFTFWVVELDPLNAFGPRALIVNRTEEPQ